ncbi:hypothetical protein [Jiella sonneratiae]|uniref:Uncharacterized protein n=1 Tax=Jiella sonneratiae TaxID=2816856 RepID=A0ABS3JAS9_9HYPH|nr:hypothetical protein [Jiella sonneratiae]MBO0906250.1 hypothetical protein [Jiella sonneratiae]
MGFRSCGRMGLVALSALLSSVAMPAVPAFADDDDNEAERVETEDIFGFTEGADTGEAGERELAISLETRFGKGRFFSEEPEDEDLAVLLAPAEQPDDGPTRFVSATVTAEAEYALTDRLKIGAEIAGVRFRQSNVFDPGDFSSGGLGGLAGEVKYRLLDRSQSPIGLALAGEVEWSRFDEVEGEREDSLSAGLSVMADVELVPDRLFAAVNLVYEPEWSIGGGDDPQEAEEEEEDEGSGRESSFEASGALSVRVADGLFLGGELRYLVAGEGLAFEKVNGSALYLGPSLTAFLGEGAHLKAAWSTQVAGWIDGDDDEDDGGGLDLRDFERNRLLVSVGFEF